MTHLTQTHADGVCTLTLNRPDKRNALSDSLIADLHAALRACAGDPQVRVVVLAAEGKVFCAGHDLREVQGKSGIAEYRDLFERCSAMMLAITNMPKPVIAQVQGMATAAGCQLVASCDLVVASTQASFATPGVHIGLFCSTPMVALSRKVGRGVAMQMLMLGIPVDAAAAQQYGLVNCVIPPEKLAEKVGEWTALLLEKSPKTLAIGKEAFYRQAEMPLSDAYDYTSEVMATNLAHADAQEGITAFLEKRPAVWQA